MKIAIVVMCALSFVGEASVTNPGFEEQSEQTGLPAGWFFTALPNEPGLVTYGTKSIAVAGQESNALFMTVAADHPAKSVSYNAHQDVSGVVAGKTYRVAAKFQTQDLKTLPMLVVQCLNANGETVGFFRSESRELTENLQTWERIPLNVAVPEGTTTFRVRIGVLSTGNAGGTAYIDDVEIAEVK